MNKLNKLNFEKMNGLIPCIVQDYDTQVVLMLGFMNEEALTKTRETGKVTFFSRTKKALWTKGETSGNNILVKEILEDCDRDTLLIKGQPAGPVCHTGAQTCFNEANDTFTLEALQEIINDRKNSPSENSYTSSLFAKGTNKIAQKVGEEAVELVIEAGQSDRQAFLNEAADLVYHYLILLSAKGVQLRDVLDVLKSRNKQ